MHYNCPTQISHHQKQATWFTGPRSKFRYQSFWPQNNIDEIPVPRSPCQPIHRVFGIDITLFDRNYSSANWHHNVTHKFFQTSSCTSTSILFKTSGRASSYLLSFSRFGLCKISLKSPIKGSTCVCPRAPARKAKVDLQHIFWKLKWLSFDILGLFWT